MRRFASIGAIPLVFAFALMGRGDSGEVCPPGGTDLRWEGFGRGFFERNCSLCHDYRSYPEVYELRAEILDLVLDGNMPPITGVPAGERSLLGEWMACDLPYDGPACPPGGTSLGYDGFGLQFFGKHCLRCHSKELSGAARNGAPRGLDWDDPAAVSAHSAQIREQVMKAVMPASGPPVSRLEVDLLLEWIACGVPLETRGVPFRRGDANADGTLDISDAVATLLHLFASGPAGCLDAIDSDASLSLEVTDAVALLQYLFLRGPPLPEPFLACGSEQGLGCAEHRGCAVE